MAPTPTKKKKSALLNYALDLKPAPGPAGARPNTAKGPGGISKRPLRGRGAHLAAPNTPIGRYANRLVLPGGRLPSIQYRGQADATAGLFAAVAPSSGGGGGGGSWFQNLGKDFMSVIQGVPGTLSLAGRTLASAPVGSYGYTAGLVLPGGSAAREFSSDVGRDWVTAGKAVGQDFKQRWGPLFTGDLDEFGRQIKQHPGFFLLDAATIASAGAGAAAKGAQGGAKIGRAMTRARHTRQAEGPTPFPVNAPPPGWSSSILRATASPTRGGVIRRDSRGRPLAQQPRRGPVSADTIQPLNPNTRQLVPQPAPKGRTAQPAGRASGQLAPGLVERLLTSPQVRSLAESRTLARRTRTRKLSTPLESVSLKDGTVHKLELPTSEVALRRYSPNVLTRQMQKAWDERAMGALESFANRRGKGGRFSTEARDARAIRREARMIERRHENRRDQGRHSLTRDFETEVLYNRKFTKDPKSEMLLALRLDNVAVDKPGRSAMEGMQQFLATQERRLAESLERGMTDEQVAAHRANIELAKSIPAEMIANPPRHVLRGEEAARRMLTRAQDARQQVTGKHGITAQTRQRADLYREAVETGQAEWDEGLSALINPEKRERLLREHSFHNVPVDDIAMAAREMLQGGIRVGKRPPSKAARAEVERLVSSGALPQPIAGQWLLQGNRLRDYVAGKLAESRRGKIPLTEKGEVDTKALAEMRRADPSLDELINNPSNLFRPGEAPAGGGVFRGSYPVGYAGGHKKGKPSTNSLGEMGGGGHQTTGYYMGRDSFSREALLKTVTDSLNAMHTQAQVTETINRFALRAVGSDKPLAIRTVDAAQGLDFERWQLVSVNELKNRTRALADADVMDGTDFAAFSNREEIMRRLREGDESAVALPRPLMEEIDQAVKKPHELLRKYDSALNIWRAGILAYTPRWFINNLVGTTIFLGVMSGLDVKAFRMASRKHRAWQDEITPFEAESVSHSSQIGARDIGRGGLDETGSRFDRSGFMRGAHQMFLLNQRLEGRLRRAAYIAMAKQNLRNEGLLRGRNPLVKLSDDELLDAMIRMPEPLKEQTLRDMEFFVGQYKSYGTFEKAFLRRVIPFWSWLRVINTWAFGLPFKSPIRAEAVRVASTMGYALQEDMDGLPLWERGRIMLPGGIAMRTNNVNPLYSVAEEIAAVTGAATPGGAATDLTRVLGGSTAPPLQIAIGQVAGRNPFGTRDFTSPVGYGDTVNQFGAGQMRRNPVTGEIEFVKPSPPPWEQAMDQLIPFAGPVKSALAGQRQPYDTSSVLDLTLGKLGLADESKLYQPPAKTPTGRGRLPAGLSPLSGLLGAPLYTVDRKQEELAHALSELRYSEAERSTARLRLREALRRQMGVR